MKFISTKEFIYRNARPLDVARFKFLFGFGTIDDVLNCLSYYQNEDGGFGHGLELDCLNPNSSPMQTLVATQIINEIGGLNKEHNMICGILYYLSSKKDFDGSFWANTIATNNDYPHAPWWNYNPNVKSYNPTASLAGFILLYGEKDSEIYNIAKRVAKEAYLYFKNNCPIESMHTVVCFVELYEYLKQADVNLVDMDEYYSLLIKQLSALLSVDTTNWDKEYVARPSLYISSKESDFYKPFINECKSECNFIRNTMKNDGTWTINWEWDSYPEEWAVVKNYWKCDQAIRNLKFYFGVSN